MSKYDENDIETWRAFYYIGNLMSWESWQGNLGYQEHINGFGIVKVLSTVEDSRRTTDYYRSCYEYPQGSTAPAGMVFQVNYPDDTVRFFQKTGTYDSYGNAEYDGGEFVEVRETTKTVTAFERVTPGKVL